MMNNNLRRFCLTNFTSSPIGFACIGEICSHWGRRASTVAIMERKRDREKCSRVCQSLQCCRCGCPGFCTIGLRGHCTIRQRPFYSRVVTRIGATFCAPTTESLIPAGRTGCQGSVRRRTAGRSVIIRPGERSRKRSWGPA